MTRTTIKGLLLASSILGSAGLVQAQDKTLTIESWRNDDLAIWQEKLIPAFEAKNPGIKVVFSPSAPTEYNSALNAKLDAGSAGDLITCRPFDPSLELYNKKHLADLTGLAGMYVRVQIQQGLEKNAITVPQQAVQRNNAGQSQVYVVTADKKVEFRNVTLGRTVGERWQVTAGLKAGEKVIVEGFQKIAPGAPVEPTDWNPGTKPGTGQQSAAAAGDKSANAVK